MKLFLFRLVWSLHRNSLFFKIEQILMRYKAKEILTANVLNEWTLQLRFVYHLQIWFHRIFYWVPEIALRTYTNVFDED